MKKKLESPIIRQRRSNVLDVFTFFTVSPCSRVSMSSCSLQSRIPNSIFCHPSFISISSQIFSFGTAQHDVVYTPRWPFFELVAQNSLNQVKQGRTQCGPPFESNCDLLSSGFNLQVSRPNLLCVFCNNIMCILFWHTLLPYPHPNLISCGLCINGMPFLNQ